MYPFCICDRSNTEFCPFHRDNDFDKLYSEIKRHGGARIDQIFGDWPPQEQLPVVGDEEC